MDIAVNLFFRCYLAQIDEADLIILRVSGHRMTIIRNYGYFLLS